VGYFGGLYISGLYFDGCRPFLLTLYGYILEIEGPLKNYFSYILDASAKMLFKKKKNN
jgi:hypothetical protein